MTREDVIRELCSDRVGAGVDLIVGHNLHSAYLYRVDDKFRCVYDSSRWILVDGQPVRWIAGLASGRKDLWNSDKRIGSVDWIKSLRAGAAPSRIAVVGASSISNARTVEILSSATKRDVRGWPGERWDDQRAAEVVEGLRMFQPNLTLIGLGMPLQEHFLARYKPELPGGVYALVGGAIDQVAGTQRRAPSWLGGIGLEWAWRLVLEPRRFAHRYLIEPFLLLRLVVTDRRVRT